MKKTPEEFYRLVGLPGQEEGLDDTVADGDEENRCKSSTEKADDSSSPPDGLNDSQNVENSKIGELEAKMKALESSLKQDNTGGKVAELAVELEKARYERDELKRHYDSLVAWKESEVAKEQTDRARGQAVDLCPQCKENVDWSKLPLVEGPLGFLLRNAYRVCPKCGHQERIPR